MIRSRLRRSVVRQCAAMTAALVLGSTTAVRAADTAAADDDGGVEVATLVAPVALYPDPLLGLVLQASTQPLQIVQADRFLAKRASDPSLTPDPGWDSSILGLLNYPPLVQQMSEYLEWTDALGGAVADDLERVQAAIQDIRWSSREAGILKSDDRQKVIVDGDNLRIVPADAKTISIPRYDPVALLAAIQPVGEGDLVEADLTDVAVEAEAAPAPAAAPPAPAPAPAAPAAAPAAAPVAPVEAAPVAAVPPGYAPVAYAPVAAVPMSYSEPSSSFWDVAAPFAGGAIVGGILGYALSDDDDDENGYYGYHGGGWDDGGRNINIEDSTVIVGGQHDYDRDKVENELRQRRETSKAKIENVDRPNKPGVGPAGGVAPAKRPATATRDTKAGDSTRANKGGPAMKLPGAPPEAQVPKAAKGGPAKSRPATQNAAKAPAAPIKAAPAPAAKKANPAQVTTAKGGSGMTTGLGAPRRQVKKEADRGAQSRQVAKPAAKPQAARPAKAPSSGGMNRGGSPKRDADRGKQSRGGGKKGRGR